MAGPVQALLGFPPSIQGAWFGPDKCGSPEAASLDGSAGRLAPTVPPLHGRHADTASAGSPGDTPTSPLFQQGATAPSAAVAAVQQQPQGGGGSSGASAAQCGSKRKMPPELNAKPAGRFSAQQGTLMAGAPAGSTLPLDLPLLDDFDDVPGLDDLLMEMSGDGDALFADPFGPSLEAPWPASPAADPLAAKPASQSAAAAQLPVQHAAQGGQAPALAGAAVVGNVVPAALPAALRSQPPAFNPFASSARPLEQQPRGVDKSASADTRRRHSSLEQAAGGSSCGGGGGGGIAAPSAARTAGAVDAGRAGSSREGPLAPLSGLPPIAPAKKPQHLDALAPAHAQPGVLRQGGPSGDSMPSVGLAGMLAAQQPEQQQQQPQHQTVQWLAHDPSMLRPVKRAARCAPPSPRPELNPAALKLSPLAALVAAPATPAVHDAAAAPCGSSDADLRLLRFLFGPSLPARW